MPSTYTNLGIEKIGTGEQSGTWGTTTNLNLDIIDQSISAVGSLQLSSKGTSGSPNDLPVTDGELSAGRVANLTVTSASNLGAGSAFLQLSPTNAQRIITVTNSMQGTTDLELFQGTYSSSRSLVIANGDTAVVKFSGTGLTSFADNVYTSVALEGAKVTGDITVSGNVDGRDVSVDGTKLDTIASGAQVNVATNITVAEAASTVAINSSTGGDDSIAAATTSLAGVMTASDKTKLNGIATGAQVNVPTNISISEAASTVAVNSSTGSDDSIAGATQSLAGVMTATDKTKLDGIEAGADVNVGTNISISEGATTVSVNSSTGSNDSIAAATASLAGVMTGADKTKLNGIATGADAYSSWSIAASGTGGTSAITSGNTVTFTGAGGASVTRSGDNITINASGAAGTTNITVTEAASTIGIASSSGTGDSIAAATTSLAGAMTAADKTKLNGIATGAQVNVGTNLGQTRSASAFTVTSSTGTNVSMPAATSTLWGMMTDNDKAKLDGIAAGAQVNVGTNISISESATTVAINSSTGSDDSIAAATTSLAGVMTGADKTKLNGIATSATNTAAPAITSNGSVPSLASGITAAEVRSLIGAGTSSTTGTVTSVTGGNGLTGSVTTSGSLSVGAGTGITVAADTVGLSTAGAGAGTYGSTANTTKIDQITLDAYGRVTAISTGATGDGDITGVTAGNGLYGGGTTGTVTVNKYSQMTVGGTQTISDGELISVNTSGQTITLPSSPAQGDTVYISVGKFTNTTIAKNGSNISGLNENLIIDVGDIGITLIYSGNATQGWRLF